MAASHTTTVEIALAPQQAEAAVYQAFLAVGLSRVVGGNGFMQGKVSMGMRSWGKNRQNVERIVEGLRPLAPVV